MKNDEDKLVTMAQGDIYLWAEAGSSVMLKAVTTSGDPVEITAEEALELAEHLKRLAAQVN